MATTYTEIPPIEQHTIECDLRAFTRWLNDLKDQVNYVTKIYTELKDQVENHEYRIHALETRMTDAETMISDLYQQLANLEGRVTILENSSIGGVVDALNGRIDMLYGWLPVPYGTIDSRGWKFAMGDINATVSATDPTSVSVPGIYTSGTIEDNDVNFN